MRVGASSATCPGRRARCGAPLPSPYTHAPANTAVEDLVPEASLLSAEQKDCEHSSPSLIAYCRRTMVGRIGCGGNTLALRRRGEAMTLSPSLRVRRGSSSALRTRLDGNEPGCHVRTRTGARGSKSRPRSSPTTSLRAVAGPRSQRLLSRLSNLCGTG